jgi:hypothetical protein
VGPGPAGTVAAIGWRRSAEASNGELVDTILHVAPAESEPQPSTPPPPAESAFPQPLRVGLDALFRWVRAGARDLRCAPGPSLFYGLALPRRSLVMPRGMLIGSWSVRGRHLPCKRRRAIESDRGAATRDRQIQLTARSSRVRIARTRSGSRHSSRSVCAHKAPRNPR